MPILVVDSLLVLSFVTTVVAFVISYRAYGG